MNKRQKEVIQHQLDAEKAVLARLEKQYQQALTDINDKIRILQSDELTQSRIYHIQYQNALKKQVEAALEKLHSDEYSTIRQYLSSSYTDAFIGTFYDVAGQGIPIITPVDRKAAVKAIMTDTRLNKPLYDELGIDINELKKAVSAEITRGLATGLTYEDMARNMSFKTKAPLARANTIIRTESHRIQQASAEDARQVSKSKGADVVKQWDATLDGDTRDTHSELDGQIRETDEPFEANGKKAMYPGDFGDPAEDCNCRCVALTRARWALDEDELKTLKDRAEFFGLNKTKGFDDFKKKYLKAAEESAKKVHSIETVNKKATDTLLKSYDDMRVHFGLNTVPADELKKLPFNTFTANYTGLSIQSADAFNDTITKLSNEYYTGFTRIEVADPKEFFGSGVFASTKHLTTVGQKTLSINPLKTKDYDKMVEKIEGLSKKGYTINIAKGKADEYVATHEFAHSLMDMKSSLKNYVGMDVKPFTNARKKIEDIYQRYKSEVRELETTYKKVEGLFITSDDPAEMERIQADFVVAKANLRSVKISQYSLESSDEFFAEAFAQSRIGTEKSPYTNEVMEVIDKLFKK